MAALICLDLQGALQVLIRLIMVCVRIKAETLFLPLPANLAFPGRGSRGNEAWAKHGKVLHRTEDEIVQAGDYLHLIMEKLIPNQTQGRKCLHLIHFPGFSSHSSGLFACSFLPSSCFPVVAIVNTSTSQPYPLECTLVALQRHEHISLLSSKQIFSVKLT